MRPEESCLKLSFDFSIYVCVFIYVLYMYICLYIHIYVYICALTCISAHTHERERLRLRVVTSSFTSTESISTVSRLDFFGFCTSSFSSNLKNMAGFELDFIFNKVVGLSL